MTKIFRSLASNIEAIINLDIVKLIILKENIITLEFVDDTKFHITADNEEKARESFEKIFTYWNS